MSESRKLCLLRLNEILFHIQKRNSSPKNKCSVIIYLPSCSFKTCGTFLLVTIMLYNMKVRKKKMNSGTFYWHL